MKKQWLLIPVAAVGTVAPLSVSCSKQSGFDVLLHSYKEMLKETINLEDYEYKTLDQIKQELKEQTYTGVFDKPCVTYFFDNIDYTDEDRAIWPAHQHIVRTLQIAMIADRDNNKELMDIAIKLTCYWLCNNYENSNWWFNEIGVPRDLSNLAIFIKDKLSNQQQNKLMEWIHHGSLKYNEATHRYTGTNTFWASDITMKSACLAHDKEEMNIMLDFLYNEIKQDDDEGFQSDGSYFQHGKMLYSGGYGRQGAIMLAKIASAFADTNEYQLDDEKLGIVVDFALDGMRYMTHKGNFTWQCMGRTHTRKQASDYAGGVTDLGNIVEMKYVANLPNCPRRNELKELIRKWEKRDNTFNGIKFFPRSKCITANYDGIYMCLRGTRKDLINCEMGNGENMLGHNMSFGFTNAIMQNGSEYADISPVWEYDHIPGTVCITENDTQLHFYDNDLDTIAPKEYVDNDYSGYNEDENVAFISQTTYQNFRKSKFDLPDTYKGLINYTIASFACEDGVVVLGQYSEEDMSDEMHVTIDQFIPQGYFGFVEGSGEKQFRHNNVVYSNIGDSANDTIKMLSRQSTRPWGRNNESYSDSEYITKDVLTLTMDNEVDGKYAYAIQPQVKINNKFKVAHNEADAQAIQLPNGKIACIFYEDEATFTFDNITCTGNKGEFKIFS